MLYYEKVRHIDFVSEMKDLDKDSGLKAGVDECKRLMHGVKVDCFPLEKFILCIREIHESYSVSGLLSFAISVKLSKNNYLVDVQRIYMKESLVAASCLSIKYLYSSLKYYRDTGPLALYVDKNELFWFRACLV